MCFSASASFGISAVLLAGGIASVKYTQSPKQIPFATIPFIFSAQQFCEGVLWLSLENETYAGYSKAFTYLFLIFAQVVWPTLVPFSIWLLEKDAAKKKILSGFLITGVVVSVSLAYFIARYPVSADISSHHIQYNLPFASGNLRKLGLIYLIPTIFSPLVSSVSKMWIIGVALLLSYLSSKFLFGDYYVISVWCFFAAGISAGVFLVVRQIQKTESKQIHFT